LCGFNSVVECTLPR